MSRTAANTVWIYPLKGWRIFKVAREQRSFKYEVSRDSGDRNRSEEIH
jgi:hypothetical protein